MQALITTLSKKIKTRLARGMLIQTLKGSLGNEKKRAGYRRLLMVLVPVYIFIVMVTIHTKHIHMEKPYLPFFSAVEQGIVDLFKRPLQIFPLPPGTGTSILGVTLLGILSMLLLDIYQSIQAHDDPNTVQGDAQWMDALDKFNMEYSEPLGETGHDDINNMIFSKEIFLSKIAGHDMNLNALVIGGSGSGKSFRYVGWYGGLILAHVWERYSVLECEFCSPLSGKYHHLANHLRAFGPSGSGNRDELCAFIHGDVDLGHFNLHGPVVFSADAVPSGDVEKRFQFG